MNPSDSLEALLDSWQEAQALGVPRDPAELCHGAPALLPELSQCIALLNLFEALRADTEDGAPIAGEPANARPPTRPAAPAEWSISTGTLSPTLARQVDAVCNRFEAAWRAGERPRLEDYLRDAPATAQAALLGELLALEIAYRRDAGETPQAAEYQDRFADLTPVVQRAFQVPVPGHPAPADGDRTEVPVIPGYEILDELGHGGMGVVYRAANPLLRRDEALKIMLPEIAAKPHARERFLREARAMAAVRHDHVVEIYRVGKVEGVPFLAMPLLEGETLATRLKREKVLPPTEVMRIGREMADGLAAAHAKGLIHRDIKPRNVWLEAGTNRVKLLDFGLALDEGSGHGLTREGMILGTPAYMSPEQVNGERLDARSDLFSVGSVLYECATGRQAFAGPTLSAVLAAVGEKHPPAARTVNPQVPAELSDLIDALLHKTPGQRPASAQALSEQLRGLATNRPPTEPAITTTEYRPPRRRRRWPGLVAAGCLIGLGLVGVCAFVGEWPFARPEPIGPGTTGAASSAPEMRPDAAPVVPGAASSASPGARPAATERLRVLKTKVHHFVRIGANDAKDRGLIGEHSFGARLGDQVTVRAKLSRPAYAYLIAFRPDGVAELCFPENEDEPPPLWDFLRYPLENRNMRYGLSDGVGLMVFAVVASNRPLPAYKWWKRRNRPLWGPAEGTVGEVWWDDGDLLDTLTVRGGAGGDRAKGEAALGRSAAMIRLTDSLKKGESVDAVGALGFVVEKR